MTRRVDRGVLFSFLLLLLTGLVVLYAASYYNAQDKWNDDHSLLGLGFEKMLAAPTQEAAARWPRQCSAIRTCLDRLARYEAEGSEDLDAVSGCFGELMAELFD